MGFVNRSKPEMGFFGFRLGSMGFLHHLSCCFFFLLLLLLMVGVVCSSESEKEEEEETMGMGVERCGLIWKELRNNVTRDLYGMERGLKILMAEKEVLLLDDGHKEKLDQIPKILHGFLSWNYRQAEKSLESLSHLLSAYLEANLTSTVYIPESVVDFSKEAMRLSKRAQISIQRLIHCCENVTALKHENVFSFKDSKHRCSSDGTKCQYSKCAEGNKLPYCAVGFATGVTGGASGSYYIVNRTDDNNIKNPAPGTLRHAVTFAGENEGGAWIVFKESMEIKLLDKLWIKNHTTIDGRGVNVTIIGKGLALASVENIILHNFEVVSTTGKSDTIHVFAGTQRVWIDHITSRDAILGLVTVLQGSTDITISNCYLSNHNFNMLLGASDHDTMDQVLRVTVYRNWFESSNQRMPHCRWGYCHVVNNYYRDWHYYAIGGRVHAKILSELNVFEPGKRLEVTPWHDQFKSDLTPTIESSKDLLLNGATFHQFLSYGTLGSPESQYPSYRLPTRSTHSLTSLVTNCSGVLFGQKLKSCLATQ